MEVKRAQNPIHSKANTIRNALKFAIHFDKFVVRIVIIISSLFYFVLILNNEYNDAIKTSKKVWII